MDHIDISDHSLIYLCRKISFPRKEAKIKNTRQYKYYYKEAFRYDLNKTFQYFQHNPNYAWNNWKAKFLLVADLHAPSITRKVRSEYTPWITHRIEKSIYFRDYLKRKAVKTGYKYMHQMYRRERNLGNKLYKHTKANYYIGELN